MGVQILGYQWVDDDDDDNDTTQQNSSTQLPAPARKHLRQIEKENADLKRQLAEVMSASRRASLADKVSAKGFDPKVASFIPESVEDVDAWLDVNGPMFAKAGTVEETPTEISTTSVVSSDQMRQMENIARVSSSSLPSGAALNAKALIEGANSKDELDKLMATFGNV